MLSKVKSQNIVIQFSCFDFLLLNYLFSAQVCDATGAENYFAAGYKNNFMNLESQEYREW